MSETHTSTRQEGISFLIFRLFFFLQLFRQRMSFFFCHHSNFPFIFNMREEKSLSLSSSFEVTFKINSLFPLLIALSPARLDNRSNKEMGSLARKKNFDFLDYFVVENF